MRVLLIDNSPTPLPDVGADVVMSHPENLGVGRSWNAALGRLFGAEEVDRTIVVNNDVRLRKDTYRLLSEPVGGFVTGVGVHTWEEVAWDVPLQIGVFPKLTGGPDFSCFVIRRPFYQYVGPFDECFYPAYREDNAYHYRAKHLGVGNDIFSVNVPYLHIGGGSAALKAHPELRALNSARWEANGRLYDAMFGGPPGREKFYVPFQTLIAKGIPQNLL